MSESTRLVWDWPLRVFHWLLVVSFLASWITARIGTEAREYHMLLGFWMLGLILFRIAWGFVGTHHSRFANFIPRPRALADYLRASVRGQAPESVGHNPLGSLMVFAILILLGLQAVSGLFIDDDVMYAGPYRNAVSREVAAIFSTLHHNVVDWIVVLAIAHIAAVLYYALVKRQRLVRAMITGRKTAAIVTETEAITGSRTLVALLLAAAITGLVYVVVALLAPA